MKIALCNEVLRNMEFPAQCEYAAALGFDGLELAPFTLGEPPHRLPPSRRRELRRAAEAAGIEIVGLHWLLVTPTGLSINSPDDLQRRHTVEVLRGLIELCAELGGKVMVHGSPQQRNVLPQDTRKDAWERARETFRAVAREVEAAGIRYCLEPLAPAETNFLNTVAEAAQLAREIESPAFMTMIDTKAAAGGEERSAAELIDEWLPQGVIGHIHLNDRNRRGPGQGEDRFTGVLAALRRQHYQGIVSVEPFDYVPDGCATAARSIGYLRGILESLDQRGGNGAATGS